MKCRNELSEWFINEDEEEEDVEQDKKEYEEWDGVKNDKDVQEQ